VEKQDKGKDKGTRKERQKEEKINGEGRIKGT
jgi:hypothetical protein